MIRALAFALTLLAGLAGAVEPDEMLKDPALEARAREISQALRCVVCQNETIDESHAELARDMRLMVRRRVAAGDSNEQVLHYMVSRYGDFVLLKPRLTAVTILLWGGPPLLLLIGGMMLRRRLRTPAPPPPPLSPEEQAALAALTRDASGAPRA
jgi:cytochrome c-type biogenesis protein CcmH